MEQAILEHNQAMDTLNRNIDGAIHLNAAELDAWYQKLMETYHEKEAYKCILSNYIDKTD
jgi:hypothetical protein